MAYKPTCVGIVNFNGEVYLDETLKAVHNACTPGVEILLADNASTDGSLRLVRERFPAVRVIELPENFGPGAARNALLRAAPVDRVMLIDNDVLPQPGCFEALNEALDNRPQAVIAMPAILYADRPDTVQYCGALAHAMGLSSLLCADTSSTLIDPAPRRVTSAITACIMVDRARWRGSEWFDEAFFLYLEDHELGLRAALLGHELVSVSEARCLHHRGQPGISIRHTGEFTATRVRHTIQNRWQILLKLYEWRTLLKLSPALIAFEIFLLGGAIKKGWLRHWLAALAAQTRNLRGLMQRRRLFQKSRIHRDLDVLHNGPVPYNRAMHSGSIEQAARRILDGILSINWRLVGRRR